MQKVVGGDDDNACCDDVCDGHDAGFVVRKALRLTNANVIVEYNTLLVKFLTCAFY